MNKQMQPCKCGIENVQDMICDLINTSGKKKISFANILGVTRQALYAKTKQHAFSISDVEKICSALGYQVSIILEPM